MITVHDLHKHFGGFHAVDGASLSIAEGSITGLIGPNGAGKTTLFNLVTGLIKPDSGTVHFNGQDITHWPTHKRAHAGLTRTFQAIRIFPKLTLIENLTVALKGNKQKLRHIFMNQKKLQQQLHDEAMDLLKSVNLHEKASLMAGELSYGQQKLLEVLRAVALDPEMVLLDEPAAGVNRTMLNIIVDLIKKLQSDGKTVLVIEHDMGFIMDLCEKIIVMDYGKEIAEGKPDEIQNNPKVLEAYLGRST